MNIYEEHGYKDRADYLQSLAETYGAPIETVIALADLLGQEEDFDGLINALQEYGNL